MWANTIAFTVWGVKGVETTDVAGVPDCRAVRSAAGSGGDATTATASTGNSGAATWWARQQQETTATTGEENGKNEASFTPNTRNTRNAAFSCRSKGGSWAATWISKKKIPVPRFTFGWKENQCAVWCSGPRPRWTGQQSGGLTESLSSWWLLPLFSLVLPLPVASVASSLTIGQITFWVPVNMKAARLSTLWNSLGNGVRLWWQWGNNGNNNEGRVNHLGRSAFSLGHPVRHWQNELESDNPNCKECCNQDSVSVCASVRGDSPPPPGQGLPPSRFSPLPLFRPIHTKDDLAFYPELSEQIAIEMRVCQFVHSIWDEFTFSDQCAHKCKPFDIACKLCCEYSHWPQCVPFAYTCYEVLRVLCEQGLRCCVWVQFWWAYDLDHCRRRHQQWTRATQTTLPDTAACSRRRRLQTSAAHIEATASLPLNPALWRQQTWNLLKTITCQRTESSATVESLPPPLPFRTGCVMQRVT